MSSEQADYLEERRRSKKRKKEKESRNEIVEENQIWDDPLTNENEVATLGHYGPGGYGKFGISAIYV